MIGHPPMVGDRPAVTHLHRKLKNKRVLGHFDRRHWCIGRRWQNCTRDRAPSQEPVTRKLLKLQSRPTLMGPVDSISRTISSHCRVSKAAPRSMATSSFSSEKMSSTRHVESASGR